MKHHLTPFIALAAIVAVPAAALASPNLDFTVIPPPGVTLQTRVASTSEITVPRDADTAKALASARPLIYPDIPAKETMDDHMAVLTPLPGAVAAPRTTALIVPRNGDAAEALASAETTYLASECPAALSHPADHSALLDRFCQTGRV